VKFSAAYRLLLLLQVFNGCAEMAAKVNKFHVTFPVGATAQEKMVLLGTTMLIDFEYFEKQ
jgi:hypothetical protein